MSISDKNLREKEFHNKLQSKKKGRFENIFYKAISNAWDDFYEYLKSQSKDTEILDYGCGTGLTIKKVVEFNPRKITGIDISEVSIEKAIKETQNFNEKVDLSVDNCERTRFASNKFDIIYGLGILHHLEFSKCLKEMSRILKPGGSILFIEPLGTNPLINLYRKMTPNARSKDEHPLKYKDFNLIEKNFKNIELKYYGFFTLVFFPFYSNPKNSFFFKTLTKIDQFLFKNKYFRTMAWSVLIKARKI